MNERWNVGRNRMRAGLPDGDRASLDAAFESVAMHAGEVLRESNVADPYAYFPTSGIVSVGFTTRDGASSSLAMIGNEGLVNLAPLLGGQSSPTRWHVLAPGQAMRVRVDILLAEFERGGAFMRIVLRYVQALISQIALSSFCNRHHTLQQQLCRWLLMSHDRLATQQVEITHGLVAAMLGVRRETVSVAAHRLKRAGIIRYARGTLEVLEREALERCTCDCYSVGRRELDRLVPPP